MNVLGVSIRLNRYQGNFCPFVPEPSCVINPAPSFPATSAGSTVSGFYKTPQSIYAGFHVARVQERYYHALVFRIHGHAPADAV